LLTTALVRLPVAVPRAVFRMGVLHATVEVEQVVVVLLCLPEAVGHLLHKANDLREEVEAAVPRARAVTVGDLPGHDDDGGQWHRPTDQRRRGPIPCRPLEGEGGVRSAWNRAPHGRTRSGACDGVTARLVQDGTSGIHAPSDQRRTTRAPRVAAPRLETVPESDTRSGTHRRVPPSSPVSTGMSEIVVQAYVTLDGVVQGGGGPHED